MSQTMPFTDEKIVQNCMEFLDKIEKPACDCNAGVRMCKHTPCIGTVDDVEKLINAGYSKNLMLDWWVGEGSGRRAISEALGKALGKNDEEPKGLGRLHRENPFEEDVQYLSPAVVGSEGKPAKFIKTGVCNLLVDNRCSVHHLNLKPVQGRMSCCKINRVYLDESGKQQDLDDRVPILHTWNTQRGKDLIERWKKEVNFDANFSEDTAPLPKTVGDLFSALFDVLESHTKLYAEKQKDEVGQVYDDRPVKTVEYVKNY